jgi:hypothetical protein
MQTARQDVGSVRRDSQAHRQTRQYPVISARTLEVLHLQERRVWARRTKEKDRQGHCDRWMLCLVESEVQVMAWETSPRVIARRKRWCFLI